MSLIKTFYDVKGARLPGGFTLHHPSLLPAAPSFSHCVIPHSILLLELLRKLQPFSYFCLSAFFILLISVTSSTNASPSLCMLMPPASRIWHVKNTLLSARQDQLPAAHLCLARATAQLTGERFDEGLCYARTALVPAADLGVILGDHAGVIDEAGAARSSSACHGAVEPTSMVGGSAGR